jgi:hypothetical protein
MFSVINDFECVCFSIYGEIFFIEGYFLEKVLREGKGIVLVHYIFIFVQYFPVVISKILNFNCLYNGMKFALISVCLGMEFEELNSSEGCLVF